MSAASPDDADMREIVSHFDIPGQYAGYEEIHSGIINRTYLVRLQDSKRQQNWRYIFQRINTRVFRDPYRVMDNIIHVTEHIKRHLLEANGSYARRVLSFAHAKDGKAYFENPDLGFWRAYEFVDNTVAYNSAPTRDHVFQAGKAFGQFQLMLTDYDATSLYETIPDFHHTVKRLQALHRAIEENRAGRLAEVRAEADFILSREADAGVILNALASGAIPWRVTHNDTKINNVLFDADSVDAICVIDLDTVMPGSSLYDFGDAIRSGACAAAEDEPNLDLVEMDLEKFRLFTKGFIKGTHSLLTENELEMMPVSCKIMTLELAARFLTDYLNGDEYFHITDNRQNLRRARTQIKLVGDMEQKLPRMREFTERYAEQYAERFAGQPTFTLV